MVVSMNSRQLLPMPKPVEFQCTDVGGSMFNDCRAASVNYVKAHLGLYAHRGQFTNSIAQRAATRAPTIKISIHYHHDT